LEAEDQIDHVVTDEGKYPRSSKRTAARTNKAHVKVDFGAFTASALD